MLARMRPRMNPKVVCFLLVILKTCQTEDYADDPSPTPVLGQCSIQHQGQTNDHYRHYVAKFEDCQQGCETDGRCLGSTFMTSDDQSQGQCFLHDEVNRDVMMYEDAEGQVLHAKECTYWPCSMQNRSHRGSDYEHYKTKDADDCRRECQNDMDCMGSSFQQVDDDNGSPGDCVRYFDIDFLSIHEKQNSVLFMEECQPIEHCTLNNTGMHGERFNVMKATEEECRANCERHERCIGSVFKPDANEAVDRRGRCDLHYGQGRSLEVDKLLVYEKTSHVLFLRKCINPLKPCSLENRWHNGSDIKKEHDGLDTNHQYDSDEETCRTDCEKNHACWGSTFLKDTLKCHLHEKFDSVTIVQKEESVLFMKECSSSE